jgi:hypothetical protein
MMTRPEEPEVLTKRGNRHDEVHDQLNREANLTFASETLRNGQPSHADHAKSDERVSLFWRVFGGSILSICALALFQSYQSLTGSIHELRADQNRMREQAADFVKKDELGSRTTSLWNRVQDLNGLNASVTVASNKLALIEQQLTAAERERKEMLSLTASLAALRDKDAALEKQYRDAEAERKDLARELQVLRERLAKLEGQQAPPKKGEQDGQ